MAKIAGAGTFDPEVFQRGMAKCMESYDDATAAALFARFAKNNTWQTPTLVTARSLANLDNEEFTNDPRLKYMPQMLRDRWKPKNDFRFNRMTPESFASQRAVLPKRLEIVGAMHRAGVGILAGTDALNPYCFPGFSLHDELELLVQAGLTPTEALQTATRNPAIYLEQVKDFGTIEPGKIADLVLLDADPTADIANTRAIAAVIFNGKLLESEELQKMLVDAEALASTK
jgi:imidazolonepropionase-like amidohydrolase